MEEKEEHSATLKHFASTTNFTFNKENQLEFGQFSQYQNKSNNNSCKPDRGKASDFLKTVKQWKDDRQQRDRSKTPQNTTKTQTEIKPSLNWLRKADSNK